jgi:uncharacterized BrkB/YihY/UPF0761 family membrane protein
MQTRIFDFPVVEFGWYGIVSIMALLCFASLSYEVKLALDATERAENEDAHAVVRTTYNVNFVVMVISNIALMVSCFGILVAHDDDWRSWFAVSILVTGAYWFYTRACEKKLIVFLQQVQIYPRTARPGLLPRIFKRT